MDATEAYKVIKNRVVHSIFQSSIQCPMADLISESASDEELDFLNEIKSHEEMKHRLNRVVRDILNRIDRTL